MITWLTATTVLAYLLATLLLWRDRTLRPFLLLLAGSITTLSQPIWSRLFANAPQAPGNIVHFGEVASIPLWAMLGGGVLLALPPLFIVYGLRHGWWNQHYLAAWGFFVSFFLFFLILEVVQARSEIRLFVRPTLPRGGRAETLLHALLLAATSFGLLYAFVTTRHFALQIAMLPLLLSGLAASVLLFGILCSPLWVARLLDQPDRIVLIGAAVSALLLLWAVHLLASGLHEGRQQRLQWR